MHPLRHRRRATALAALALLAAVASACGASGSSSTADGEMAQVNVGIIPIIDVAPLKLGIEKGFFSDRQLEVTTQDADGGAAIVPAVVSGDVQFGYSNVVSLMIARSKGLPLNIVAAGARASDDDLDDGSGQLMTMDPDVETVQDLEGSTIGVNTLAGISEITVRTSLEEQGVTDISVVEVPIPSMPAALEDGQVQAALVGEPFITIAEDIGARPLPVSYSALAERLLIASWFTSESYAAENEDVVERFTEALNESLEYAEEHPEEVRAELDRYLELEPGVSAEVTLPGFDPSLDQEDLTLLSDLSEEQGLIPDQGAVTELLSD